MAAAKASERAYTQLRTEILDGTLPPGVGLGEVEQSARLGLSRTPLREALARLVADGLVEPAGGRGLVVADLPTRDIDALFEMRVCLESEAARLAALRVRTEDVAGGTGSEDRRQSTATVFRTYALRFGAAQGQLGTAEPPVAVVSDYYGLIRQFDEAIDTAADNSYLVDALNVIRLHVARVRRGAAASRDRLAASADEHALIAEAIAGGDESLAVHAVHVHLHRARRHVSTLLDAAATG